MAVQYAYNYAVIDETGMCIHVFSDSHGLDPVPSDHVEISEYNEDYLLKYYNRETGLWYEDAAFTIEWSPA